MGKQFDVEWDDFSGGYWLGTNTLTQPRNTWRGDDVIVAHQDGTLKPGAIPVVGSAVTQWRYAASRVPDPRNVATDSVWYENPSPYTAQTIKINGTTVFTTSGTLNPYHAKRLTFYAGNKAVFGAYTDGAQPKIVVANYETNTAAAYNVSVEFGQLHTWGDHIVAAYFNRLYYSAPGDPTSWASGDYYDIGDATITAFCTVPSGLLIGTNSGWFIGSGVLGDTFALRRANTTSAPIFPGSAVDSSLGVLFRAGDGMWALRGTQAEPVAYSTIAGFGFARSCGPDFTGMSCPGGAFIYSEATQSWRKITSVGGDLEPYEGFTSETTLRFFNSSLTGNEVTYDHSPAGICLNGTAFAVASATLADFTSRTPFTIKSIMVEVDCGDSSNNYTRTIGVQVVDPVRPLEYGTVTMTQAEPDAQTVGLPAMNSTAGERFNVTFGQPDSGALFGFAPKVTMRGVKVRRVVARCMEVS